MRVLFWANSFIFKKSGFFYWKTIFKYLRTKPNVANPKTISKKHYINFKLKSPNHICHPKQNYWSSQKLKLYFEDVNKRKGCVFKYHPILRMIFLWIDQNKYWRSRSGTKTTYLDLASFISNSELWVCKQNRLGDLIWFGWLNRFDLLFNS